MMIINARCNQNQNMVQFNNLVTQLQPTIEKSTEFACNKPEMAIHAIFLPPLKDTMSRSTETFVVQGNKKYWQI